MSSELTPLQRLENATDYRQLREIFRELADQAAQLRETPQLVGSIDQAIQRIEQERSRDASELETFEQQYSEFRNQQQGILGWFRRHVPFTETRRIEVQHQATVADQRAEILADNLVIARAQILKQKLLPPEQRQLGKHAEHWRSRFQLLESIEHIGDYAKTIQELSEEIAISTSFVNEIQVEIDAFATAKFSSKDDQQRQREDLAAARNEVAELKSELDGEITMRNNAITRAGELVEEELQFSDHGYFQISQRLTQLNEACQRVRIAEAGADQFSTMLKHLRELDVSLDECLGTEERLNTEQRQCESELQSAQQRLSRIERKLDEACGDDDQDKSALEQLNEKHQRRRSECDAAEQKLEQIKRNIASNSNRHRSLLSEIDDLRHQLPETLRDIEPKLDRFFAYCEQLSYQPRLSRLNDPFDRGHSSLQSVLRSLTGGGMSLEHGSEAEVKKLLDAIKQDHRELNSMRSETKELRDRRWLARCKELLGEQVAKLVTASTRQSNSTELVS